MCGLRVLAQTSEPSPISLDAESSSFDRQNNTVEFTALSITQDQMQIRADHAVASALDFEQSDWRFTGNVVLTFESATIEADSAEIVFVAHQLQSAELLGAPATFEDTSQAAEDPIRGGATQLSYDNVGRVMHMSQSAWLTQGLNEFRGCDLIYDLDQETITSGSSECGEPVVITILPPAGENRDESSSTP
jgi:lipopolysaccharide transport protein LptA